RHFDQPRILVAVEPGGEAELAGEDDGALLAVVEQHGGAVAAIVGFADLALPAAVAALQLEGGFLHLAPVVAEQLARDQPHLFAHSPQPRMEPVTKTTRC